MEECFILKDTDELFANMQDLLNQILKEHLQEDDVVEEVEQVVAVETNIAEEVPKPMKPSIEEPPELELKSLSSHLKYTYLGNDNTLPVIIATNLSEQHELSLLQVLQKHKQAIGWTIVDIPGISERD